jgi:nucleotide-binding universal stress UspA family protein
MRSPPVVPRFGPGAPKEKIPMKTKSAPAKRLKKASARGTKTRGKVVYPRLRRLLVPLDFSGRSREALLYAIPLAQQAKASLVLLHVVEPVPITAPELGLMNADLAGMKKAAMRQLDQQREQLIPAGLETRALVRIGMPAAEIVAAARREKIDLIAMSTHSRGALKRFFIGSTADQVMRNAHCPVLSVRLH